MSVDLVFAAPLIVQDADPVARDSIRSNVHAFLESEQAHRDVSILADAGLEYLEELVLTTARSYLERTLKLPARELEIEHARIDILEPGSQEGQHSHDGCLLSCRYYVEAPKDCGCIVFPDPIEERRSYRELTQTAGSESLTRQKIAVEPQPGRLVMFESWMEHYFQRNNSKDTSISIAIDVRAAERPAATRQAASVRVSKAPPQPFLFNELFEIEPDLNLAPRPVQDKIPLLVIDNVLKHPDRVREVIGAAPAANWKHEAGGRNFVDYYDCRLRFPIRHPNTLVAVAQQAINKIYGERTRPADASVDVNWFMQINEKRASFAVPHSDITENVTRSFTCVLYLNDSEECSGGTAFFRFKPSDSLSMDEGYARAVHDDPRMGESGLDYWPADSGQYWEQIGEVEMRPGRLIVFPSEFFHAAWHPENSFYEFPRLTLAYWMIT